MLKNKASLLEEIGGCVVRRWERLGRPVTRLWEGWRGGPPVRPRDTGQGFLATEGENRVLKKRKAFGRQKGHYW